MMKSVKALKLVALAQSSPAAANVYSLCRTVLSNAQQMTASLNIRRLCASITNVKVQFLIIYNYNYTNFGKKIVGRFVGNIGNI